MQHFATKKRRRIAFLVAEDRLTDEEIARTVGVNRTTIHRLKKNPQFIAMVEADAEAYRNAILTQGIADRVNRVAALDDRWQRMQQVIAERGTDEKMQEVPGGKSGLLVHQVKGVGKGEDFQLIDTYAVDTGLLAEIRNHEKQAAQELGQWIEKSALTDPTGQKEYVGLTDEERTARLAEILNSARARRDGLATSEQEADTR